ncbi:GTP binding [Sparganum proliferum]
MGKPHAKDKVNKSKHSLNPDRGKQEKGSTMRSKATIKRLNMYRNFKAKRDKKGRVVRAAPFQSTAPSGSVSRVEPNRRWFGNVLMPFD